MATKSLSGRQAISNGLADVLVNLMRIPGSPAYGLSVGLAGGGRSSTEMASGVWSVAQDPVVKLSAMPTAIKNNNARTDTHTLVRRNTAEKVHRNREDGTGPLRIAALPNAQDADNDRDAQRAVYRI
jgi:hypothetical protein